MSWTEKPEAADQKDALLGCPCEDAVDLSTFGKTGTTPPPYLPQPGDELPAKIEKEMGPIGPWATGRVSYLPEGGMTGIRPVGDRYSITRVGPSQWRARNQTIFQQTNEKIQKAQITETNATKCVKRVYKEADDTQLDSSNKLRERAATVFRWKNQVEQTHSAMIEEINLLENERLRVKQSLLVLNIPECIAGEFLQLRANRMDTDQIRDEVEEELVKELANIAEIRNLFIRTREQIETQMTELKAAKKRLENDWSDKFDAYNIDSNNAKLNNDSRSLMWYPGSVRFPGDQSTPASYETFTQETINDAEAARKRSIDLRAGLEYIYKNPIKDLQDQAFRVDAALAERVKITDQVYHELEKELLRCLKQLVNTENLIATLRDSARGLNSATKLAQTRLQNRMLRRNVENCRDTAAYALIDEVKTLGERVAAITGELKQAEDTQAALVKARGNLEREIFVTRKAMYIDKNRGQLLRSFYPSLTNLAGH